MCTTSTQWARQHLARQLGFLLRSCHAFDEGYVDEAIRIATVLRVLVYDTRASTSVLTHLNAKDTIRLLSTCPELRSLIPGTPTDVDLAKFDIHFQGLVMTRLIAGKGAVLLPGLDRKGRYGLLSVHDWWHQIVWVVKCDQILTRGVIILTAANQDGGAPVDSTLTPVYEALAADGVAGTYVARSTDIEQRGNLENAHFVSLRQMAYEVLNSTSITQLGSSTCGTT
jgi:hypothetical protein